MHTADIIFAAAVVFVIACNLYFAPRIRSNRVAMQWGFDGKPTWYAPKRFALWGPVALMLVVRLFIWFAETYAPQYVHGVEIGIAGVGIVVAAAQLFVLRKAERTV